MQTLRTMYDSEIPDPISWLITRWNADPFARGSYSSYGVNSSPADAQALGETVNDILFFAGEATHPDHQATVHGALLSGYRAAQEVINEAD